jgi:hypothetical protein
LQCRASCLLTESTSTHSKSSRFYWGSHYFCSQPYPAITGKRRKGRTSWRVLICAHSPTERPTEFLLWQNRRGDRGTRPCTTRLQKLRKPADQEKANPPRKNTLVLVFFRNAAPIGKFKALFAKHFSHVMSQRTQSRRHRCFPCGRLYISQRDAVLLQNHPVRINY